MSNQIHLRNAVVMFLLTALLITWSGAAFAEERRDYSASSLNSQEKILISLIREDRAKYGLGELSVDAELCAMARMKSADMLANNYFSHLSPTYGRARQMLSDFGVSVLGVAENIARNRTIYHSHAALLSSAGHRRNLMGKSWTHMGVGVAVDKHGFVYVTELFARK